MNDFFIKKNKKRIRSSKNAKLFFKKKEKRKIKGCNTNTKERN